MKDHGATGRHRLPQEHRLRQLLERGPHAPRGTIPHLLVHRHAWPSVEPLRSRTVLQIMDGLRGVWHGGPFARTVRFVFYPEQILFGTDPVAIDRLLLDIIDDKRRAEGAISIWDRSPRTLKTDDMAARDSDPNVNILIREPGHVEYASTPRAWRARHGADHGAGAPGMTGLVALLCVAALQTGQLPVVPCVYWARRCRQPRNHPEGGHRAAVCAA